MYELFGIFGAFFILFWAFCALLASALYIFRMLCLYFIFEKAGIPGWKAIIPLYCDYTYFQVAGLNGWWFLMELIPVANIIFLVFTSINIAEAFKKPLGYIFGIIFLPDIFKGIIAFDKSQYSRPTKIVL